jgi:hypothetical protein
MIRRLGAVLIVPMTIAFAACQTTSAEPHSSATPVLSSGGASDELAAIRAVLASGVGGDTSLFPPQPGRIACVIQGGGPYPAIRVSGTCQTSVSRNGSQFLVTLTEYWEPSVFHGDGDPSTGQLSHSWRYKVDSECNVTLIDSLGNFPPQEVR